MATARIVIRPLSHLDSVKTLTALIQSAYAPLGARGLHFNGVDQPESTTADRVAQGVCLVAQAGNDLVGTILVHGPFRQAASEYLMRSDVAYFQQFAVRPDWQRMGVGVQLLAQAEACAGDAGYAWLGMDTAIEAHEIVAWYLRRGYTRVEEMQWPGKNYRSVIMSKRLPTSGL